MAFWLTPSEITELDRNTINAGTPGLVLMERAGLAVARTVKQILPDASGMIVLYCGSGNNGGDGFVTARILREMGYNVIVRPSFGPSSRITDECRVNMESYVFAGGLISHEPQITARLAVDALLGVGFTGNLRGGTLDLAVECSSLGCPVVAVDIPTGVDGLTGKCDKSAVKADITITFAAPKLGLLIPPGCGMCGSLLLEDIGIHIPKNDKRRVMDMEYARSILPSRPVDSHKGTYGKVLVLGGSEKMPGAPMMVSMGALRAGCGLVELCVPLPASTAVAGRIPETICSYFLPGDVTSLPDPDGYSVAVIGPGMGKSASTEKVVRYIVGNWKIPLVLDADALNVIDSTLADMIRNYPADVAITPHPGELRRLTGCGDSLNERFQAAEKTAKALGVSLLLKGKPSQAFSEDGRRIMTAAGNHGLSTGGTGDVLAGIVAGLMAQGCAGMESICLSSFIHGMASELYSRASSPRSLLPDDLVSLIGEVLYLIEHGKKDAFLGGFPYWTSGIRL
ncbi:hypothetical protein CSA37_09710 [Candidatus Fermentibacteria bacterium]|nr:MAG: hypothetical protein CSA37_09710 [Candidatus Fermentibacteria bacterium]